MHKLGSSPLGCEDFNLPGSITNEVSVQGRPLSVIKVLCNLGKAKGKQRLDNYYNNFVGYLHIYIYIQTCTKSINRWFVYSAPHPARN